MAMGIYVGAGGVKTVNAIRVGAGGVKTVNAVYVGAGGVKQVWPSIYTITGTMSSDYWGAYGSEVAYSGNTSYVSRCGETTQNGMSCITWNPELSDTSGDLVRSYKGSAYTYDTLSKYDFSNINYVAIELSTKIGTSYDDIYGYPRIGVFTSEYIVNNQGKTASNAEYYGTVSSSSRYAGSGAVLNKDDTAAYCYLINTSSVNASGYLCVEVYMAIDSINNNGYGSSEKWRVYFYDCLVGTTSTASDYGGDFASKGFKATITLSAQ